MACSPMADRIPSSHISSYLDLYMTLRPMSAGVGRSMGISRLPAEDRWDFGRGDSIFWSYSCRTNAPGAAICRDQRRNILPTSCRLHRGYSSTTSHSNSERWNLSPGAIARTSGRFPTDRRFLLPLLVGCPSYE